MIQSLKNIYRLGVKEIIGLGRDWLLLALIFYSFTVAVVVASKSQPDSLNKATIAVVDDDRRMQFCRQRKLRVEAVALHVARRKVVVIVEPDLANRDHAVVRQRFADMRERFGRELVRRMRMHACAAEKVRRSRNERSDAVDSRLIAARFHDVRNAFLRKRDEQLLAIRVKLLVQ